MKGFLTCLVIIAALSLFASCKSTAILSANFESDAVGGLPVKNLPGNPVGDSVNCDPVLQPRIKIVASGSEKALSFTQVNTPDLTAHNQFISFKGIPTGFAKPMWF